MKAPQAALRLMQFPFRNSRRIREFMTAFGLATTDELPTLYASFVTHVATDAKAIFTLVHLVPSEPIELALARCDKYLQAASELQQVPTEEGIWELAIEGMNFVVDIHVYIQVWRGHMETYERGIQRDGHTGYEDALYTGHMEKTAAFQSVLDRLRAGEAIPKNESRNLMLWQASRQQDLLQRYLRQLRSHLLDK